MYFVLFLTALVGALIAPIFSFPKFFIFIPFLFVFVKKKIVFWIIFIFLVFNILGGISISGKFEFVGRVIQTNDNYSIAIGKIFYNNDWEKLRMVVGINEEIPIGDVVYYYGNFEIRKYSYPKIFLDKNRVIVTPYFSFFRTLYERAENFRNKLLNYNEIYYGLFGGKVKNKTYSNSGIYHFFSVSGMHISMIYSLLIMIFSFSNFKYSRYFSFLFLFVFIISFGLNLPTLRAFLFLLIGALFSKFRTNFTKIDVLSIIGMSFLFFEPALSFSLSFYMSFFSTLGILAVERSYLKPIAAFLGCAPFLSLFSNVNIFSILATFVLLIPFQVLLVVIVFSYFLDLLGFVFLESMLLKISLPISKLIDFVSNIFSKFPKIPGGIVSYFIFLILFFFFILNFGQISYNSKNFSKKIFSIIE